MTENEAGLSPVYQAASDYVDALAALDPVMATGAGIAGHETEMTDYSPEGYAAVAELRRSVRARLDATPITNERDRIAADAMREHLDTRLALFDAQEHLRLAGSIGSAAAGIRRVFDLMPHATADDFERIAKRLAFVPGAMASFEATLDEGIRSHKTGALRQAEEAARQAKVYSGQEAGTPGFFSTLVATFDAAGVNDPSLRKALEQGAASATEAFAGFARYVEERYMDAATTVDGVGRERYALQARGYNGITLDLDETYAWGWEELYRIEDEMRKTCARILPGASIDETKAFLESDPNRAIDGVEAFREWMQALQERTVAELDGVHFDLPGPVRNIEAMIAPPGGAAAMYYTGPSEDFSRPGRTWYPTMGKTRFPLWGEVSIAYHEGVPGHHFQIATTKYLAEELSRFQRLMGGTSGYVEGWALYAERLMGELGYLENPDYYLGMLRAQAMRAVRVVVDIGMHLSLPIPRSEAFHGGETWDATLGDTFARQRAQFPEDFMKSEVTRYLGAPGQAISYKVGERCWLEAREASKQRQGDAFDLKAWHAAALNLGPMGLAQMQRELAAV